MLKINICPSKDDICISANTSAQYKYCIIRLCRWRKSKTSKTQNFSNSLRSLAIVLFSEEFGDRNPEVIFLKIKLILNHT